MAEKTTLPFAEQVGAWILASLFSPYGAQGARALKPQLFKQLFGNLNLGPGATLPPDIAAARRYTQPYDPWSLLQTSPRPGGPTQAEQDLLNNALFGLVAPLDLSGARAAMVQPGAMQFGTTPQGPLPFDPRTATGESYNPQTGRFEFTTQNPEIVWWGPTNQFYYKGREITPAQYLQLLAQGPAAASQYGQVAQDIYGALGGQLPRPVAPTAPSLHPFSLPASPRIDVGGEMQSIYQSLLQGQPGLQQALTASLNPRIALPSQSIFDIVNAAPRSADLDRYVNSAVEGMRAAYERELANQEIALQSRFAGEGSYLSGPMFSAMGQLRGELGANFLRDIGQLQLAAAEAERARQYGAATTQYGTEFTRNVTQVQERAQQSRALAQVFGTMAAQAAQSATDARTRNYAAQLQALASAYGAEADFLASTFGTQANVYGNQLAALINQQATVANAIQRAMELQRDYAGMSFDQALRLAEAEQRNRQSALDLLREEHDRPGFNTLQTLLPLLRLPTVSKATGGGFDIGALVRAAATAAAMA
jgi:hypothetical protein